MEKEMTDEEIRMTGKDCPRATYLHSPQEGGQTEILHSCCGTWCPLCVYEGPEVRLPSSNGITEVRGGGFTIYCGCAPIFIFEPKEAQDAGK